ncbi:hypothetical protein [Roseibium sp. Sym1]|uniref:hypothetical protein n=1 Tax=Roseibium sp. Sym1 TaxID=3016006 RepID=UPI0022B37247|nr:hypothetical protein [Roseibium sp. Sym1]
MHKFDLNEIYRAEGDETTETRIGVIYHALRNKIGSGSISTPIARYFVWRPNDVEGFNPHWRIDCYAMKHKLSSDPKMLARLLTDKLREIGLCDLPVWVSWHESTELGGEKLGDLWEED